MKRLLIINQRQFGYLTDTYRYCEYLRDGFEITYVCWDYRKPRIEMDGVKVVYVSRDGVMPVRFLRYLRYSLKELRNPRYDVAFVVYFRGCTLLQPRSKSVPVNLDIRTGSVLQHPVRRWLENQLIRLEAASFSHVSIISESLRRVLRLPGDRCHVLPVGGESYPTASRSFSALRLLYVGTLYDRAIEKTVQGFDRFCLSYRGPLETSYEIVGDGPARDRELVVRAIEQSRHRDKIRYYGRIPNKDLLPIFERNTVGLAFIPKEKRYDPQPSSKVFEYLVMGMPVIATSTLENRRTITPFNGVLIDDSAEGVERGLHTVLAFLNRYDSEQIRGSAKDYTWSAIVESNLRPYLFELLSNPSSAEKDSRSRGVVENNDREGGNFVPRT